MERLSYAPTSLRFDKRGRRPDVRSGAETRKEKRLVPMTVKMIAALLIVGFVCTALSESNPLPLVVMVGVAWVVWQVGKGFAAGP